LDELYVIFLSICLVYLSSFRRGGFGDKRPKKVPGIVIFLYIVVCFLFIDEMLDILPRTGCTQIIN